MVLDAGMDGDRTDLFKASLSRISKLPVVDGRDVRERLMAVHEGRITPELLENCRSKNVGLLIVLNGLAETDYYEIGDSRVVRLGTLNDPPGTLLETTAVDRQGNAVSVKGPKSVRFWNHYITKSMSGDFVVFDTESGVVVSKGRYSETEWDQRQMSRDDRGEGTVLDDVMTGRRLDPNSQALQWGAERLRQRALDRMMRYIASLPSADR